MRFKIELDVITMQSTIMVLKKTKKSTTMLITDCGTVMDMIETFLGKKGFRILESDIELIK